MDPMIEPASASDEDALVALLRGQYDEHDLHLSDADLRAAIRVPLADPARGAFLVARVGGRAVGVAYLAFVWTLEHGGKSAWLEELYVEPAGRVRGVGTALLRAALDHAAREGCAAVDLEVEAGHARAEHLYEREGFIRRTRARWFRRRAPG